MRKVILEWSAKYAIKFFEKAGLELHDIIIVDYGAAFLKSFLSDVDYLKIMPKQHAFIIVAKKPAPRATRRAEHREELLSEAIARPIGEDEQTIMF